MGASARRAIRRVDSRPSRKSRHSAGSTRNRVESFGESRRGNRERVNRILSYGPRRPRLLDALEHYHAALALLTPYDFQYGAARPSSLSPLRSIRTVSCAELRRPGILPSTRTAQLFAKCEKFSFCRVAPPIHISRWSATLLGQQADYAAFLCSAAAALVLLAFRCGRAHQGRVRSAGTNDRSAMPILGKDANCRTLIHN